MSADITNRVRVGGLDEITPGSVRRVDIGEHRIAVVRIGDRIHAIGDTCSHAEYSLSEGELDVGGCAIECPRHGASFSLVTGEPETLPATRPVPVYETEIEGDDVWIVVP